MIGYLKSVRAERKARNAYRLAVLDSLMRENCVQLDELRKIEECPICCALESPKQREVCASR